MKNPYLLAKALAYAIVAIESRPETIRERADYHDMVLLFRKLPANEREMFLDEARRDLVNYSESVSVENLPVRDELPSNRPPAEAIGDAVSRTASDGGGSHLPASATEITGAV